MGAGRGKSRRTQVPMPVPFPRPYKKTTAPQLERGSRAVFHKLFNRAVLNDLFVRHSGETCTVGVVAPDPSGVRDFLYTIKFDDVDDSLLAYPDELSPITPSSSLTSRIEVDQVQF